MLKIGLTGLPGSGKTTVTSMFKLLGVEIISADAICHSLLSPCKTAYHEILNYFGKKCLNPDQTLNRDFLRHQLIFSQKQRKFLEEILHPKIHIEIKKKIQELERKGSKIVVIEVPLLFEVGWEKDFDLILTVDADEEICLERLKNKGFTEQEARRLLSLHLPPDEKRKRAHLVIENKSTLNQLYEKIKSIWQKFSY